MKVASWQLLFLSGYFIVFLKLTDATANITTSKTIIATISNARLLTPLPIIKPLKASTGMSQWIQYGNIQKGGHHLYRAQGIAGKEERHDQCLAQAHEALPGLYDRGHKDGEDGNPPETRNKTGNAARI
jgi:hypothetical protein